MNGNLAPVWLLAGCAMAFGYAMGWAVTGWRYDRRLAARIRFQLDDMRALGREEGYEEGLIDGRGDPGGTGSEEWSEEEPLEELPPERSREELGFTGPQVQIMPMAREPGDDGPQVWAWQYAGPAHERHEPDATGGWRVSFTDTGTLSLDPPTRMTYDTALVEAFPALGKDWAA